MKAEGQMMKIKDCYPNRTEHGFCSFDVNLNLELVKIGKFREMREENIECSFWATVTLRIWVDCSTNTLENMLTT